jgi:hypothetical protein
MLYFYKSAIFSNLNFKKQNSFDKLFLQLKYVIFLID